jgi:hypothetical protein
MEFTTIKDFFKSIHQGKADFGLASIAGPTTTSEVCPEERVKENELKTMKELKQDHKSIPSELIERPAASKVQVSKRGTPIEDAAIKQINAIDLEDQSQSSELSMYHMEVENQDALPQDHSSDLCSSGLKVSCFILSDLI